MPFRTDVSDSVIHFTKGENDDDAYSRLKQIIESQKLIGSNTNIRGEYKCICFTETPLKNLEFGLLNHSGYSKYSCFGIKFKKKCLFELGGRPVIYQPLFEYELLQETIRWRYMRYEPEVCDFLWEREWRILADELPFNSTIAEIVVPNEVWKQRAYEDHRTEQDLIVQSYGEIMDELIAEQYRKPQWGIVSLDL